MPSRKTAPLPLTIALALSGALAPAAAGQTGPFADGELLVRTHDPVTSLVNLYRIDPVTGQGAVLLADLYAGYSGGGWLAYDPYRDAVLAYTSTGATGYFSPHLLLIRADGQITDLGFVNQQISAMAPVGDGRVYLRKAGTLHVLDATNQLSVVTDAVTGLPIILDVAHLAYDPSTGSLIGAADGQAVVPCAQFGTITVHRLPLNANGTQVVPPVLCTSFPFLVTAAPVGLDPMPGGAFLLTLADGYFTDDNLLRVDPAGPSVSLWAEPTQGDLDGGVFSQRIGKAVVFDDGANELRTFVQGQQGAGTPLPSNVIFPDPFTGWSSANRMIDINRSGPGCAGLAFAYGQGLAGTGGAVPTLGAGSCPRIGAPLPLAFGNARGGTVGVLVFGAAAASLPVLGGTLLVAPPLLATPAFGFSGSPGTPGSGAALIVLPMPADPSAIGVPFYGQGAALDAGAPQGLSLTQGLEIRLG